MLRRRAVVFGILGALTPISRAVASACIEPTQVLIVPVMHKLHQGNTLYGYSDIYRLVAAFRPDQVGVEIRQEDLDRGDDYLARNYPAEMAHLAKIYESRVFGFDWLGDDLAGKAVPNDWWKKHSRVKQLERSMDAAPPDRTPNDRRLSAQLASLGERQEQIAVTATATTLADGRYDAVTAEYYATLKHLTDGTQYSVVSRFYSARDKHLNENVIHRLHGMKGGRVAIVTGMDHHGPMVKAIEHSRDCVRLLPVS